MNKHNCKNKFEIGQKFICRCLYPFLTEIVEVITTDKSIYYKMSTSYIISEETILNGNFELVTDIQKGE